MNFVGKTMATSIEIKTHGKPHKIKKKIIGVLNSVGIEFHLCRSSGNSIKVALIEYINPKKRETARTMLQGINGVISVQWDSV